MVIQSISPFLDSENLEQTVDYYTSVLGFECNDQGETWISLVKGSVHIMFGIPNAHIPFDGPKLTGSIYLYTDDVDKIWEELKDRVKLCYELDTFDYGMREFGFYDNNGYLLKIGQSTK